MSRYHTTGRDSWSARTGYVHESPQHARLVRNDRRPSHLPLLIALAVIVAVGWITM